MGYPFRNVNYALRGQIYCEGNHNNLTLVELATVKISAAEWAQYYYHPVLLAEYTIG